MNIFTYVFILPLKSHLFHFQIRPPASLVFYHEARGLVLILRLFCLFKHVWSWNCLSHESLIWSPFLVPGGDSQYANYDWLFLPLNTAQNCESWLGFLLLLLFFKHVYSVLYIPVKSKVKVLATQSCLTICIPMDCSPPGCSVHEISQARILEWVAIFFSRATSQPRNWTRISCIAGSSLPFESSGKPHYIQVPVLNINIWNLRQFYKIETIPVLILQVWKQTFLNHRKNKQCAQCSLGSKW